MSAFYNTIFYQPIFNLLIGLYNLVPGHDIGVAIIILTVLIKLVLWPVSAKALKSQKALSDLQPKVEELKRKYKDKEQKEELAKKLMELYSQEKVNPASSCLPLLIQLPVFIALYQAMSHGLQSSGFELLYSFVSQPEVIEPSLLGVINLALPSLPLALAAGIGQFFQARMMVTRRQPKDTPGAKDEQMLSSMNKQMMYVMPFVTVFIGMQLPGGLALYWFVMNLLTIAQQAIFFRKGKPEAAA